MASIHVAVIAWPGAALGPCLEALAAAGVSAPQVVRATGGTGPARNTALAACDADVLALVEDDVAVGPGWFKALHGGWDAADETLGCTGAPIRAAFPGGRPPWLSDASLGAFGLQDMPGATFHGGNVAWNAAALRGINGFWPARGTPGLHDWFGEEHHAQRELWRAGWSAAWLADAAAERLVPAGLRRRDLLRARRRTGARGALLGGDEPSLRTALVSGAGAAVALAAEDPAGATAVDRAGRAAAAVGALLAERAAASDLETVGVRTPFRHTLPRPATRRRRGVLRRAPAATGCILLYHRVHDTDRDPLGLAVRPAHFAEHVEVLAGRGDVVDLETVAAGRSGVALTFDDGYVDASTHAAPALRAAGLPATLFVATGAVAAGRGFWWDAVPRLLDAAPADAGPLQIENRAWPAPPGAQREAARRHLQEWLQGRSPEAIAAAVEALAAWAGVPDGLDGDADRALTLPELRELAEAGPFTFGAHTRTHRSLAQAPPEVQRAELAGSSDDLARWTGRQPAAASYPFGVPGTDVDATTVALAEQLGFACAVVNAPGLVTASSPPFALPRLAPPDADGAQFAAWLDRAFRPAP